MYVIDRTSNCFYHIKPEAVDYCKKLLLDHYKEYGESKSKEGFPATDELENFLIDKERHEYINRVYDEPVAIVSFEW